MHTFIKVWAFDLMEMCTKVLTTKKLQNFINQKEKVLIYYVWHGIV